MNINIKLSILLPIIIIILILSILIPLILCNQIKDNEEFNNRSNIELSSKLTKKDIKNIKIGQKKMSNMLKVLDEICQKNNIKYFLVGGSLLGTVLYKGWIPWDGDVDLVINKNDYEKFKKIIQLNLPKNMWFQNHKIDKNYPKDNLIAGKIRDLNSCYIEYTNNGGKNWHNGLQIDILLYDDKNSEIKFSDKNEPNMNYDDIYPLQRKPFEDFKVNIMNNSKKYLDNKYGVNWIEILPRDKRLPHEGLIDANKTCEHHYKLYPNLYHNK